MADFLLEIGLEEVPARMIAGAEAELGKRVSELLTRERLLGPNGELTTYSTPRRLAVLVEDVLASQADTEEQLTGPSWKVAFKDGAPTVAAEAFAKKAGVAVEALERVENAKGEYVGAKVKRLGRAAADLLAAELPKEVLGLYWAKNMYWRAGKPERFVRPVRWVVALLDSAFVPLEIAGIAAGNASRGHRVLHGEAPVVLGKAADYADALRKAFVAVDVAERRQSIRKALDKATRTVAGARWREDAALIETVVHLTEWPTVVLGDFEPEYLALPEEVLVTVMRDHQKYFAVEGADGKLAPHFLAVLNTQVDDEGEAIIRHGNARVLRARFKDAQFFWDFDQKTQLVERVESLKTVTFQKELGSYFWKTMENGRVLQQLAGTLKGAQVPFDELALYKASLLAKTDLTTELVKEFTELQGIIGGLYAKAQGLGDIVSQAIYPQYTPASTDDTIPRTVEGQLLGLADRIQTITGMFSIGNAPTGSKDPFALRRAANGIVKILAEAEPALPLTLGDVVDAASASEAVRVKVEVFFAERLEFYLREAKGQAYDVVKAVLAAGANDVRDAVARAEAVTAVRGSEDFAAVSAAFKRMKNILAQAGDTGDLRNALRGGKGAVELAQTALWEAAEDTRNTVTGLIRKGDFVSSLEEIAKLRPHVDRFFDEVMVMDPNPDVRRTNLAVLFVIVDDFRRIADLSEIVTAG